MPKMISMYGILTFLAIFGIGCAVDTFDWKAPKYCNGLECPRFTVINTTQGYEVRKYEPSKWVTTSMEGLDYPVATTIMFRRLFAYITGSNEQNKKIDMTSPVLIKINKGANGANGKKKYSMGFYIAPAEAVSPPKPSDPTVKIGNLPGHMVFAKHFGGYAGFNEYEIAAQELAQALPREAQIETSYYYASGYDSPFKPFDRRNEVWFITQ